MRHVRALAKRSLIKTRRTPEPLLDVTLQPIIFLTPFMFLFGGAIAAVPATTTCSSWCRADCRVSRAGAALGQNLNTDIEKGVFDRFRRLPISRSVPLVGAVSATWSAT